VAITYDEGFFRNLLDCLYDAVYFVDRDRRITYWNKAAEALTGFTREDSVGSLCHQNRLAHVDDQGHQLCLSGCPLHASMRDGTPREARIFLRHRLGHRVPVRVRVTPIRDAAGDIVGAAEIFSDDSDGRENEQRLQQFERLALLDHLTGIPNRRHLEATMAARHREVQRYGGSFGVLIADIDHFKSVNDRLGHAAGDQVLVAIARSLRAGIRPFDVFGRWGGEEFLAVLVNLKGDELVAVAERLRVLVERTTLPEYPGLDLTVSVGAVLATPGEIIPDIVRRADEQLYRAKNDGRNRVAVDAQAGDR
jgi:diguanylate cyclase (GGDEF)-like protein/PAS domain S-box-containing protein